MPKYKVLKKFKDLEKDVVHDPADNEEIEFTVERANQINETLKDRGVFLERIQNNGNADSSKGEAPKSEESAGVKEQKEEKPRKKDKK